MMHTESFIYPPGEHETERASHAYLMSLVAIIAGMPLPIINLAATLIFYFGNLRSTYFVRWHCTQALLSQLSLLFINSYGFWWTVSIIFTEASVSAGYIAYITFLLCINLIELYATVYTAIQVRKGIHVRWWVYGWVADGVCGE